MLFKQEKNQIKGLYLMHSIQGFASSMVGIFIPIYFLNLDYSVEQVIKFFIAHYSFLLIFAFAAIYLARYIGLQQTILARTPFKLIYYILLIILPFCDFSIFFIAFFSGLESAMYWIPLHIIFTRYADNDNMGSATGKLFALPKIFSLFSPLIGGVLAANFGFNVLLTIVFVIMVIANIPLLFSFAETSSFALRGRMFAPVQLASMASHFYYDFIKAAQIKSTFKFEPKKGFLLMKKNARYFVAEIFDNMAEEVEAIIWPIFVFITLKNIEAVGIVGSLINIGSFLFTLFIGKMTDKLPKKRIIKMGAILLFLVWMSRYYIAQETLIYLITIVAGFVTVLFIVPFTSYGYSLPKEDEIDEFFVFREVPVAIGRILILSIALFFVNKVNIMFALAGLSYLYFLFF